MSEADIVRSVRSAKRPSLLPLARVLWRPRVLPGLLPTLGFTWLYLGAIVLIPIGALIAKASSLNAAEIAGVLSAPRTFAALSLSFGAALAAAVLNTFGGTL